MVAAIGVYVKEFFTVGLLSVLCVAMLPESFSQGLRKAVGLICGLCVILCVCSVGLWGKSVDITRFFQPSEKGIQTQNVPDTEPYTALLSAVKTDCENRIFEKIFAEYGIKPESVCIQLSTESQDGSFIQVTLPEGTDKSMQIKITEDLKTLGPLAVLRR